MDNWFKNITSGDNAASSFKNLVQQAVSSVERNLDQVLDIQTSSSQDGAQDELSVPAGFSSFLDFAIVPASTTASNTNNDTSKQEVQDDDQNDFFAAILGGTSFAPKPPKSTPDIPSKPKSTSASHSDPPASKTSSILKSTKFVTKKVKDDTNEKIENVTTSESDAVAAKVPSSESNEVFTKEDVSGNTRIDADIAPLDEFTPKEISLKEYNTTEAPQSLVVHNDVDISTSDNAPESVHEVSDTIEKMNAEIPEEEKVHIPPAKISHEETSNEKVPSVGVMSGNGDSIDDSETITSKSTPFEAKTDMNVQEALEAQKAELHALHKREMDTAKQRIAELEAAFERVRSIQSDSSSSAQIASMTRALAEKEKSIAGLLQEGEKLAKEILKSNNNVKKLRARESELEKELSTTSQKLSTTETQMQELKEQLSTLTESERRLKDMVYDKQSSNDTQMQQISKLEKDLVAEKEQNKDLVASRDRAWKELSELKQQMSEQESALQSEALEKATKKNQELSLQLHKLKADSESMELNLRRENEELQAGLARLQDDLGWKEDNWRKEVEILENRLRAAETRNEDLSAIGQSATKPLLRQIEALQAQFSESLKDAEQSERLLNARLQESERERAAAVENERMAKNQIMEMESRISTLEVQLGHERKEKSRVLAEFEALTTKNKELELAVVDVTSKMDVLRITSQKEMEQALAVQAKKHEDQLKAESEKWQLELDTERKRRNSNTERISKSPVNRQLPAPATIDPLLDTLTPAGNAAITIDRLQIQVKQLEGQIGSLQVQLREATKTRDDMADQLYQTTNENEEMRARLAMIQSLEAEHNELSTRYNTVLEILGEKTEQIEELQADIEDMKLAFRSQVQDLLGKLGQKPPE